MNWDWTSYLPQAPDRLWALELKLYAGAAALTILVALLTYAAIQIGHVRGEVEARRLSGDLNTARTELAATRAELTEARTRAEELESKYAPRHLAEDQYGRLAKRLAEFRGTTIAIRSIQGDGEGTQYARDFENVLRQAGWTIDADGVQPSLILGGDYPGVIVHVHDVNSAPIPATMLVRYLRELGVSHVSEASRSEVPAGAIVLLIGYKPQQ